IVVGRSTVMRPLRILPPENQEPQGKPRRRSRRLGAPIPVRFTDEQLDAIRQRAEADDRSVSAWIRRAVEHELDRRPA
ncbi:MAG: plasmid mobilization protein, partial [Nocardioides sp.]